MTLGLDTQSIGAALYARLATDSAGAAVRAGLGSSALMTPINGGTVAAFDLAQLSLVRDAQVPPPWAAFAWGAASGKARREMRVLPFDWWLYDTAEQGPARLNAIAPLMDVLYQYLVIANGRVTVDLITNPTLDINLGMLASRVRLFYTIWR